MRHVRRNHPALLATAVFLLAGPLFANQPEQHKQKGQAGSSDAYQQGSSGAGAGQSGQPAMGAGQPGLQQKEQELRGTISDIKTVRPAAGKSDSTVVLLKTDQGRKIAVDLGPSSELEEADLNMGESITVHGTVARLQGKPYFFARHVTAGEQEIDIRRPIPKGAEELQGMGASGQKFQGKLDKLRDVGVKGEKDKHRVAILKTAQGQRMYVDLGPKSQLQDVSIKQGDQVSLQGTMASVKGRSILMAQQLRKGNVTVDIKWPPPSSSVQTLPFEEEEDS